MSKQPQIGVNVNTAAKNTAQAHLKRWYHGLAAVLVIAALSISMAFAFLPLLRPLEEATVDIRMRWRLRLLPEALRSDTRSIVLLAIDENTEEVFGRFGAGRWLSRQPFLDLFTFLKRTARPGVLSLDIIFKETSGRGKAGVTADSLRLGQMADAIQSLAVLRGTDLEDDVLQSLSLLVFEQANLSLAHLLAAIQEQSSFPVVLGCNLRSGWDDPQGITVPYWSAMRSPELPDLLDYVEYIAIPDKDIRFPTAEAREAYGYAPNGTLPIRELLDYSLPGVLNIPRDPDGVVRRAPLVMGIEDRLEDGSMRRFFVPSFALLTVLLHHGIDSFPLEAGVVNVEFGRAVTIHLPSRTLRIPVDEKGQMRLNYRWHFNDFDAISFADVAPSGAGTELAAYYAPAVRRRIAMIGVTSTGMDVGPTPVHPNIPLVYAQMTAVNTMLTESYLRSPDVVGQAVLFVLLVLSFILLAMVVRTVRVAGALVLLLGAYWIAAYGALHFSLAVLPVMLPTVFFLAAAFGLLTFRYFTESRERRRIRGMFSTMVSDRVLNWLEDHPESFSLEGHMTSATILFSDIADFTRLSEQLEPARLIRLLNMYLTPVTDVILEAGGYLDKYVGDSVMAVWGAPYEDPRHAVRACHSALEQQRRIELLNDRIEAEFGVRLKVRMGINSGDVTAGNMGSERKFQYTVIGDVVNLASRIEPINRHVDTRILIGEATRSLAGEHIVTRRMGDFVVVGRDQAVAVYELLGEPGRVDPGHLDRCRRYEKALESARRREWSAAEMILSGILAEDEADGPSRWLLRILEEWHREPPPSSWKGEFILENKR